MQIAFATYATLIATLVTAVLAKEAARLADVTAQPQIVAVIVSNKWTIHYFDLEVENTGNAPAFDVEISFDPDFPQNDLVGSKTSLRAISLLKAGQKISSGICFGNLIFGYELYHYL